MKIDNQTIKNNLSQLGYIAKQLLPKGKVEVVLFLLLVIFYLSYSFTIALNTSILDHHKERYDLFFSFDNVVLSGVGFENVEGHPLLPVYSKPMILFGNWVGNTLGMKVRTVLFLFLCVTAIALSCVYIYRYLKKILSLGTFPALLFTLFYSIFSTNLILSFTTETFTISAFLLTFLVYIYSDYIKKEQKMHFSTHFVFSFLLGGLTITNFSKVSALMLFTKEKMKFIISKILIIGLLFLAYFHTLDVWSFFTSRMNVLTDGNTEGTVLEKIFSHFYGGSILFPSILWKIHPLKQGHEMISIDLYSSWLQYLFVAVIITLILLAIYKNYRNRLLQALVLVFLVDISLHTILQLGIEESFIYGGHWVYVVPLFLGWLYKGLRGKVRSLMMAVVCGLFALTLANNAYQMNHFIDLAKEKYPASESFKEGQFR